MHIYGYQPDTDTDFVAFCHEMIRRSYIPAYSIDVMGMFQQYHSAEHIAEDAARGRIWCARQGGELVGTATVAAGELSRVFVAPHARGTGVGRQLTQIALEYARASGLKAITSWSVPFSRGFYEKFGFATVNADMLNFTDTREPPVPYIEMVLRLDGAPPVAILPAAPEDAEEIIAGQRLAFAEQCRIYDDWSIPPVLESPEDLCKAMASGTVVLKAACSGVIAGSVRGTVQGDVGHVSRLYVHPAHQGRGIGRMLMAAVEERVGECRVFSLFTGERSEKNLALYAKQGYALNGERRPARQADPYDLVWLEKPNPWPEISACAERFFAG